MGQIIDFISRTAKPNRSDRRAAKSIVAHAADAASAEVGGHIAIWFGEAEDWTQERDPDAAPTKCVRAPAGIGKTFAILNEIKKRPDGRYVMLVPDHGLAGEVVKKAREMGMAAHEIFGRAQPDPDDEGHFMCDRHEQARLVGAAGGDPTTSLCRAVSKGKDADGKPVEVEHKCPRFDVCGFRKQAALKGAQLLVSVSDYLDKRNSAIDLNHIDGLIVDEASHDKLMPKARILDAGEFVKDRAVHPRRARFGGDAQLDAVADATACRRALVAAIEKGGDVLGALREHPTVSSDLFREAAYDEWAGVRKLDLRPDMEVARIDAVLKDAAVGEASTYADIYMAVAAQMDSGRNGGLHGIRIRRVKSKTAGGVEFYHSTIECRHVSKDAMTGIPRLITDADAEPSIIRNILIPPIATYAPKDRPPAEARAKREASLSFVTVTAPISPHVHIEQICDKSLAKCFFGNRAATDRDTERGKANLADTQKRLVARLDRYRAAIAATVDAQLSTGPIANPVIPKRPCVITYQFVEKLWTESGFYNPKDPDRLFDMLHFNALRGIDRYKDAVALVVIGRQAPSVEDVEAAAEALHYADSEPLIRIEADKGGRKMWPQVPAAITMRDGSVVMTTRDCHPDPRCEAIRRAIAAELSQAVARCRPYYRTAENPCDLIIWTDTPIEGLPVDELTRWDAEPLSVAWQSGFVPFTPAAAHAAHPALWTSPAAIQSEEYRARGAARGYDWKPWTDKSGDDAVEAAAGQGMALIAYRLPSPSGLRAGKTTRAWVAAEHCGDLDTLAAFVRGFGGHAEASDFGVLSSATARTEAEHCDDLIEASEDEALAVSLGLIAPPVAEPSTAIPMPTAFWPSPIELIRRRRKAA